MQWFHSSITPSIPTSIYVILDPFKRDRKFGENVICPFIISPIIIEKYRSLNEWIGESSNPAEIAEATRKNSAGGLLRPAVLFGMSWEEQPLSARYGGLPFHLWEMELRWWNTPFTFKLLISVDEKPIDNSVTGPPAVL